MPIFDSLRNGQPVYPLYVPGKFDFVEPSNLLTLAKLQGTGDSTTTSKKGDSTSSEKTPQLVQGQLNDYQDYKSLMEQELGLIGKTFNAGIKKYGSFTAYQKSTDFAKEITTPLTALESQKDLLAKSKVIGKQHFDTWSTVNTEFQSKGGASSQYSFDEYGNFWGYDKDNKLIQANINTGKNVDDIITPLTASQYNTELANSVPLLDKKNNVITPEWTQWYDEDIHNYGDWLAKRMSETENNLTTSSWESAFKPVYYDNKLVEFKQTTENISNNATALNAASTLQGIKDSMTAIVKRDSYNKYLRAKLNGEAYNPITKKDITYDKWIDRTILNEYPQHTIYSNTPETTYHAASNKSGSGSVEWEKLNGWLLAADTGKLESEGEITNTTYDAKTGLPVTTTTWVASKLPTALVWANDGTGTNARKIPKSITNRYLIREWNGASALVSDINAGMVKGGGVKPTSPTFVTDDGLIINIPATYLNKIKSVGVVARARIIPFATNKTGGALRNPTQGEIEGNSANITERWVLDQTLSMKSDDYEAMIKALANQMREESLAGNINDDFVNAWENDMLKNTSGVREAVNASGGVSKGTEVTFTMGQDISSNKYILEGLPIALKTAIIPSETPGTPIKWNVYNPTSIDDANKAKVSGNKTVVEDISVKKLSSTEKNVVVPIANSIAAPLNVLNNIFGK